MMSRMILWDLILHLYIPHLHAEMGEELGVIADDALAAITFEEKVEVFEHALRTRVGADDIDAANEWILASGNIVLVGTTDTAHVIGGTSLADEHDIDIEVAETTLCSLVGSSEPVGAYYADHIAAVTHGLNDFEAATLGKDGTREFLAVAERIAHVTYGATAALVKDETEVSLAPGVFEFFPTGNLACDNLAELRYCDDGIGVGLVDYKGEGIVGHDVLVDNETVFGTDVFNLIFGEFAGGDGTTHAVHLEQTQHRVLTRKDRVYFGFDVFGTEGCNFAVHQGLETGIDGYMHLIFVDPCVIGFFLTTGN